MPHRGLLQLLSSRGERQEQEKPVTLPLPPGQEAPSVPLEPSSAASSPVCFLVLAPVSGDPEAAATVLLTLLFLPVGSTEPRPGVPDQNPEAGFKSPLGALQQQVHSLQRHQTQL